jgi:hypothetical protein
LTVRDDLEYVSLNQAGQLTGLPIPLLKALVECGELPLELRGDDPYIAKAALLGWCRLYGKILSAVSTRHPRNQIGVKLSARNLVWMAQAGLLTGKDRVRI